LSAARLTPAPTPCQVDWFDVSSREDAPAAPAADSAAANWQAEGHLVRRHKVVGPSFWQTSEIEVCPDLIDMSMAALASVSARRDARLRAA
jgi:hypothetical protein